MPTNRSAAAALAKFRAVAARRWRVLLLLPIVGAGLGVAAGSPEHVGEGSSVATSRIAVDEDLTPVRIEQTLVRAREAAAAEGGELDLRFHDASYTVTLTTSAPTAAGAEAALVGATDRFIVDANRAVDAPAVRQLEAAGERRDRAQASLVAHLEAYGAGEIADPVAATERARLEARLAAAQVDLDELGTAGTGMASFVAIGSTEATAAAAGRLRVLEADLVRALLGAFLGLVGAIVVVLAVERLHPRIDDEATAAAIVGAPVIGRIPKVGRAGRQALLRVHPDDLAGPFGEAHRTIRTHLEHRRVDAGLESPPRIMIASGCSGEGKSTTAAFLAMAYAEAGDSPMVVGGDLRRPTIHRLFDLPASPGIADRIVAGADRVSLTSLVRQDPISGVTVIPSGPHTDHVAQAIGDIDAISEAAQASGRQVIVDTSPVGVANDAVRCLQSVDWVVLVVRAGRSTEHDVARAAEALRMDGASIVGVVVVDSVEAAASARAYYSYYAPVRLASRSRRRNQAAPRPSELVAA